MILQNLLKSVFLKAESWAIRCHLICLIGVQPTETIPAIQQPHATKKTRYTDIYIYTIYFIIYIYYIYISWSIQVKHNLSMPSMPQNDGSFIGHPKWGRHKKNNNNQLEHGWLKSVMIFLHARWYLSGFTGQEYSLSNDWLGQVELRMRDIMWGLWFRVWSCSIFEVWSWQHGVVLIATCMKQLRCYDISLRPQALFTRLLNVTQDLSSPLYIEKRLSSGLYHWHPCSACELSNIYEVIFAFKTVSSIAIPSPYRKRRSFLAERRLEKRSKSAFVALVGCSNVSETSHHNHFWNMLISRANQLTLVPFWDGTSRSYLMIGSIFVIYIHIYIY